MIKTAAATGDGVGELWAAVSDHRRFLEADGRLDRRRAARVVSEWRAIIGNRLEQRAFAAVGDPKFDQLRDDLVARRTDPYTAAEEA